MPKDHHLKGHLSQRLDVISVRLACMLTIEDVAATLGITERGVRLRVDLLSDILDAHLRRGPKNQLLFDDSALAVLKRFEEVRRTRGLPLRQAARVLRGELGSGLTKDGEDTTAQSASERNLEDTSNKVSVAVAEVEASQELPWAVKKLVEELEEERDYWRNLALKLQEQVRDLERLALPAPREQRPWWARGIFRWLWSS
jgi:DNA-binding transcriptional MerR regulator